MSEWISSEEKLRAQFEDFASGHYMLSEYSMARNEHQLDEYLESEVQVSWEVWRGAHEKWFSTPSGWITDDHATDKSATTYKSSVAESWKAKGWPAIGIYLNPADGE